MLSDRDVLIKVAGKLGWSEVRLRMSLAQSGRGTYRPWGANEKLAVLGALWQLPAAARRTQG
jgi:hypothetical protein